MAEPAPSDAPRGREAEPLRGASAEDEPLVELDPSEVAAFLAGVGQVGGADDAEDVSDEPEVPEIAGYQIVGIVGRGATGVVYRARQQAVDRAVALKVLHRELITNGRAVRRLQREARLAAKLAHPSIISAIDMGQVDGLWWYAMELVEGVPLSRRIAERGSLTEREILRLFSPLCDALQHAHEVGVVHRDIKPANVLIDGRGRARLVDLGLAMSQNDPSITRTGSTLGTPHYVSPEQARDPSQADIRSDIWSVGATMYHAACGRPPFYSEDDEGGVAEILSRVLYEPVVDPRAFTPSLSKGFSLLLRKCLTRDPEQRYQEPWQLVADIEHLRERRRLDVRGSRLDRYASRRPAWFQRAVGAASLLAAVGATWAMTARPWQERPEPIVVEREAELGDWPELHEIELAYDGGQLAHALALAELDAPAVLSLPESARYLASELVVRIKGDLEREVQTALAAADAEVDAALAGHEFESAERLSGVDLEARLRQRTGFAAVAELPEGRVRLGAERWRRARQTEIRAARDEARRVAVRSLQSAYRTEVRDRLDALVADNRWQDALELLEPDSPLGWLELGSPDLRGLDDDDRRFVARAVDSDVQSDRSMVEGRAVKAISDARDFVEVETRRLAEEIDAGEIKGPTTAAERLRAAIDAKEASLELVHAQVPAAFLEGYESLVDDALEELERSERRRRETLARSGLSALEGDAAMLLAARQYGRVKGLYRAALEDRWRGSTFDVLEARIRETELLEAVLERAALGIAAVDGRTVELTFERIPRLGRLDADEDVERSGFTLRPRQRSPIRVVLRPDQLRDDDRPEALMETDDILRFAGLLDAAALTPEEQLAAAAFLAAEGRPRDARARIRLEDQPSKDVLAADLEERVRRRSDARDAAASTGEIAAPEARAAKPAPRFESAYGVPNQTDVGRNVRLLWHFADDGARVSFGDPTRGLPVGSARSGAWTARLWDLTPSGLALQRGLESRSELVARDLGPVLPLVEPLRVDQPIAIRLELVPGDHRPDGHVVVVSVRGFHLLLASRTFQSRAWFGTGDLRALVDHAIDGDGDLPPTFHERTFAGFTDFESTVVELELGAWRLKRLAVGGQKLDFPTLYSEPAYVDAAVRVRSAQPMVLRAAELRGERVPRR
ncbi:MAG: serine/threonine-protein kinase [Planctomycetota bacterium]